MSVTERFGQDPTLALEFPCDFPIKVVGHNDDALHEHICAIACRHDTHFDPEMRLECRQSSAGKYRSFTLRLRATSKEQIDAVYQELKACELVLWAL